ncbi:MAG TPA: hypothetical protein VFW44_05845 [Bryobacteraceae bacterium]|nr:hypothetical protein [Bryobacteraceae bacterium]
MALLSVTSLLAQWPRGASPKLPRTADGKVNLSAPAPRTADGHPDLSGLWETFGESGNPRLLLDLAADNKPGEVVFLPSADALYKERQANNSKDHPGVSCLPSGIPEKDMVPGPYKIIEIPGEIIVLYESRTIYRQIFTDGRPLPKDPNPAWQGYSIGHWEGDTMVVETTGFRDKGWLDMAGHPASESLHVTERFTRRDLGHMDLQVTINDPKTYAKPWTVNAKIHLLPEDELIEHICEENNKDPGHMVGK